MFVLFVFALFGLFAAQLIEQGVAHSKMAEILQKKIEANHIESLRSSLAIYEREHLTYPADIDALKSYDSSLFEEVEYGFSYRRATDIANAGYHFDRAQVYIPYVEKGYYDEDMLLNQCDSGSDTFNTAYSFCVRDSFGLSRTLENKVYIFDRMIAEQSRVKMMFHKVMDYYNFNREFPVTVAGIAGSKSFDRSLSVFYPFTDITESISIVDDPAYLSFEYSVTLPVKKNGVNEVLQQVIAVNK